MAYFSRPWEVRSFGVENHFSSRPNRLVFHLRGSTVVKISHPGWITDRVRFGWDGLRRRRLTAPLMGGRPVGWASALAGWVVLVQGGRLFYRVDGFVPGWGGVARLYTWLAGSGPARTISFDCGVRCSVYHGVYGLAPVEFVGLALPTLNPYEEDGFLTGPPGVPPGGAVGLAQVLGRRPGRVGPVGGPCWARPGPCRSVFQVSPLQALLTR